MKFERAIVPALLFSGVCSCTPLSAKGMGPKREAKQPNLVFVFSDQQSYDMLGCYGNSQIITPNLDEFASQGVRFTHCFSSCPISTPFRGMLLSGQHSLNNGTYSNDLPLVPGHGKKFAEVLRDAGYATAYIGKWHLLGGNRDRNVPVGEMRYGFDELFYTNNCTTDFRKEASFYFDENDQKVKFNDWEVYGQTRQAIEYLDSREDDDRPFALFVSYHPPHDSGKRKGADGKMHYNYVPPADALSMYGGEPLEMRPGTEDTPDRQKMYKDYYASNTGVDIAFGRLMDKLEEMGCSENTIVVFTADHGDMLESLDSPLPKQIPQDYSARVPFILRYPRELDSESTTSLLFGSMDIMPTILGLMNLEVPKECDGTDLSEAIVTGNENAVEYVPVWLYPAAGYRGVITKDFTYAFQITGEYDYRKNVLYDRKNDEYQLNNLFEDPRYEKQRAELKSLTEEWMKAYGDEAWTSQDFMKSQPKGGWGQNREYRPIDLLKK